MKVTELRIDNYVFVEDIENISEKYEDNLLPYGIVQVRGIKPEGLIDVYRHGKYSASSYSKILNPNDVKPILLTKEWLVNKYGATLQPWGFVLNGFIISWNMKDKFWIEVGNGKRINLPYVHSLQNFYDLTGEELEIKP